MAVKGQFTKKSWQAFKQWYGLFPDKPKPKPKKKEKVRCSPPKS